MLAGHGRLWRANKRLRSLSISAAILTLLLFFFFRRPSTPYAGLTNTSLAQNETLGFGAIYVLTEDTTTWRVQGLLKAAELTGIRLTIPVELHLSDEAVLSHLGGEQPKTVLNEIRALLNYIALLEKFLLTGYATALFVEDDVDFGVDIKSQLQRISETILANSGGPMEPHSPDLIEDVSAQRNSKLPYGTDWDVLWLGHFGFEFTEDSETWPYDDHHALQWDHLTSEFNTY